MFTEPLTRDVRSVEARRQGIGCLCLTIGAGDRHRRAPQGLRKRRARVDAQAQAAWPTYIGPLFRAALRTADLRRKVS